MAEDASATTLRKWRYSPVSFVRECLKVEPDQWQVDVLEAFRKHQRIAMNAAKGPGKTSLLAMLAWNFLATRPYPKIAATSISEDNLADGLWAEMAKWQERSEFLKAAFTWTKTRIVSKDHPETWFMSARQWSKAADTQQQSLTLAGFHADYVLFILDEAGGIPDSVAVAAEAALGTGIEAKLLIAGNPTHLEGPLYRASTSQRQLWYVKEVTGDPDDPNRAPRISISWAKEQIEQYGRDNPWVLVNVFGKFPPASINSVLGVEEVRAAMHRPIREQDYCWSQKRLGIDVARFGDDRSVIFPRQGLRAFRPVTLRGARTTEIAARVVIAKGKWESEMEFVDDSGHWGHGVIDNLITGGIPAQAVFSEKPAPDKRYRNMRAYMWMQMAEWVKRGGSLPDIPELVGELTVPTYSFINGAIQIEDKKLVKKRLGRSPDLADALTYTFAIPDMPGAHSVGYIQAKHRGHARSEWDPWNPEESPAELPSREPESV